MDLSFIESLIPNLAAFFNVEPATLVFLIGVITTAANVTARLIPEDATGWQGTVRDIAKIIGVYVSSRVTKGVTVQDIAKTTIGSRVDQATHDEIVDRASDSEALIPEVTQDSPQVVDNAFGRFAKKQLDDEIRRLDEGSRE